jgi:hypothetical protein
LLGYISFSLAFWPEFSAAGQERQGVRRTWVKYLSYTAFRIVGTVWERSQTLPGQNESKIGSVIEEVHMRIGRYESSAGAVGTSVAFLFIGLGVGAALGLLLAPKSGRQMRKDLRRSYEDALETISDWSDEAKDRFDEAVEKGADFADELRAKAEPLTDLLRRP